MGGAGLAPQLSCPQGQITCIPSTKAGFTVLPRQSPWPTLPSAVTCEGQGQLTQFHDLGSRFPNPLHANSQQRSGRASSTMPLPPVLMTLGPALFTLSHNPLRFKTTAEKKAERL